MPCKSSFCSRANYLINLSDSRLIAVLNESKFLKSDFLASALPSGNNELTEPDDRGRPNGLGALGIGVAGTTCMVRTKGSAHETRTQF